MGGWADFSGLSVLVVFLGWWVSLVFLFWGRLESRGDSLPGRGRPLGCRPYYIAQMDATYPLIWSVGSHHRRLSPASPRRSLAVGAVVVVEMTGVLDEAQRQPQQHQASPQPSTAFTTSTLSMSSGSVAGRRIATEVWATSTRQRVPADTSLAQRHHGW